MTLRGVLSWIMTKLFPQEISSHKNTIIMFKNLSQVTSDFHIPQGFFVVVVRVGYVSSSHVTFTYKLVNYSFESHISPLFGRLPTHKTPCKKKKINGKNYVSQFPPSYFSSS